MRRKETIRKKIESKLEKDGTCHIWKGVVDKNGYPKIMIGGKEYSTRKKWFQMVTGISCNRVQNNCGNKKCLNPAHQFVRK